MTGKGKETDGCKKPTAVSLSALDKLARVSQAVAKRKIRPEDFKGYV